MEALHEPAIAGERASRNCGASVCCDLEDRGVLTIIEGSEQWQAWQGSTCAFANCPR